MSNEQRQFVELVERMREAQRRYFRTRHQPVLDEARELEREVDRAIARLKADAGLFQERRQES